MGSRYLELADKHQVDEFRRKISGEFMAKVDGEPSNPLRRCYQSGTKRHILRNREGGHDDHVVNYFSTNPISVEDFR